MNIPVIETKGLTKFYGSLCAVDSLDMSIYSRQVFGLLGPNGSGKSTTLGMILSLLEPSSGEVRLFGSADLDGGRVRIGASLETHGFFPYFSGKKNLKLAALAKGVSEDEITRVLEMVRLDTRKNDRYSAYSFGMKQRLSIASALLGNPEVIILDEPTNGLDPLGIMEIRELIAELARNGKTIIVASHLLSEMEKVCTHVAILQNGKLKKSGVINEVIDRHASLESAFVELTR